MPRDGVPSSKTGNFRDKGAPVGGAVLKNGNFRDGETLRRQGKRPAVGLVGEEGAGGLGNGAPAVVAADAGHAVVYAHFGEVPCGNVSEVHVLFGGEVLDALAQGGELEGGDSSTSVGMTGRDGELADFQP